MLTTLKIPPQIAAEDTTYEEDRSANNVPTHENGNADPGNLHEIQKLAYQYWCDRDCPDGSPEVDWYRAQEELSNVAPSTAKGTSA